MSRGREIRRRRAWITRTVTLLVQGAFLTSAATMHGCFVKLGNRGGGGGVASSSLLPKPSKKAIDGRPTAFISRVNDRHQILQHCARAGRRHCRQRRPPCGLTGLKSYRTPTEDSRHSIYRNDRLWVELTSRFQGDFDNYNQVIRDRRDGLLPREGGGHENIHCTLLPLSENTRLAAFYFDGTPSAIFRFRFYELRPHLHETTNELKAIDTVLYTLHPDLERRLRQESENPLSWPVIFHSFGDEKEPSTTEGEEELWQRIQLLPKCDVRWSWRRDPVLHAYATGNSENDDADDGIHAVMVYGQATVDSQMMPGQQILIKDQLSIWSDALWIHDRGFNPTTGEYIYGNQRDVPYALDRVSNFVQNSEDVDAGLHREVVNDDLIWTLGQLYRSSSEEYQSKIDAMGGPSITR